MTSAGEIEALVRDAVRHAARPLRIAVADDGAIVGVDLAVAVDVGDARIADLERAAVRVERLHRDRVGVLPDADVLVVVEHLALRVAVGIDVDRLTDEPDVADVGRRAARERGDLVLVASSS